MYSKAIEWSYEKEYRMTVPSKSLTKPLVKIKRDHLSEIYFGVNVEEKEKKK